MVENKTEIAEKLIKDKLKVSTLERKATLETYGLDSLDVMEFLLDLEDRLGITFETEEIKDLRTVGELLDLIKSKIK